MREVGGRKEGAERSQKIGGPKFDRKPKVGYQIGQRRDNTVIGLRIVSGYQLCYRVKSSEVSRIVVRNERSAFVTSTFHPILTFTG